MTKEINLDELFEFLKSHNQPVFETQLLREFFPEYKSKLTGGITLELFKAHFILYHHLYKLAHKLIDTEYFLYIKNINIYMFQKPDKGHCQFFDSDNVSFCGSQISSDQEYCMFHKNKVDKVLGESTIDKSGIDSYYLDLKNMEEMDDQKLDMISKGIFKYAATYKEVNESLEVMGLSIDYSLDRLKSRYRYLAKENHPDVNQSRDKTFNKIHKAYQILLNLKTYENLNI